MEGNPVTNQLASGRCWLFAMCNVIRSALFSLLVSQRIPPTDSPFPLPLVFTSRKYNLDKFQLSQSYLFFHDHLSKANYFLEQIVDLVDEPLESRTVTFLLENGPAQDGGQWDLAVNIVESFGLVPVRLFFRASPITFPHPLPLAAICLPRVMELVQLGEPRHAFDQQAPGDGSPASRASPEEPSADVEAAVSPRSSGG
jgi:hypothetical protein